MENFSCVYDQGKGEIFFFILIGITQLYLYLEFLGDFGVRQFLFYFVSFGRESVGVVVLFIDLDVVYVLELNLNIVEVNNMIFLMLLLRNYDIVELRKERG